MAANYMVWCCSYFSVSADAKECLIHKFLAQCMIIFVVKVKFRDKKRAMLVSTGRCYFKTRL